MSRKFYTEFTVETVLSKGSTNNTVVGWVREPTLLKEKGTKVVLEIPCVY